MALTPVQKHTCLDQVEACLLVFAPRSDRQQGLLHGALDALRALRADAAADDGPTQNALPLSLGASRLMTRPGSLGGVQYTIVALLHALRVSGFLRNAGNLKRSVHAALRFALGEGADAVIEEVGSAVPSAATISRSLFIIDMLIMTMRRKWWADLAGDFFVQLGSDASNQSGHEWYVQEEEVLLTTDAARLMDPTVPTETLATLLTRRVHIPTMLGSGSTTLAHKMQNMIHACRCEVGHDRLDQYFSNVVGWCSDWGTEFGLPDVPRVDLARQSQQTVQDLNANTSAPSFTGVLADIQVDEDSIVLAGGNGAGGAALEADLAPPDQEVVEAGPVLAAPAADSEKLMPNALRMGRGKGERVQPARC